MTRDTHDEARELIAWGGGFSDAQQAWLRATSVNAKHAVIMRKQQAG